jgi:hypothetical protein
MSYQPWGWGVEVFCGYSGSGVVAEPESNMR